MRVKKKDYFAIAGLVALFLFSALLTPSSLQANELPSKNEILSRASLPQKDRLTLVTIFSAVIDEKVLGVLAVYDDDATERPVDYLELCDTEGDLIAVGWFDRFGIERMAVDRGLVENEDKIEDVLVLIIEGDLI